MCKILYSVKTVLLSKSSSESPMNEFLSTTLLSKLIRFTNFCVKCYVPWWIRCTSAESAPREDLSFIQNLHLYKETDSECAAAALTAFSRCVWYLCGETISLSLFDDKLRVEEKISISSALVAVSQVRIVVYIYIVLFIDLITII